MNKRSDKSLMEKCLGYFQSKRQLDEEIHEISNQPFCVDENYIDEKISELRKSCPNKIDDDFCVELKRRIKSTFEFYQDEGEALLSDYFHVDWYPDEARERNYWIRYFEWLKGKNPDFGNKENKLDSNTDAIVNLLGNPTSPDPFAVRGLVMGDVQSGKTATYIGVITKAVDAGYRVVILLTGLTESLRRQTQRRVNEGFVGYDSEKMKKVGVGITSTLPVPRAMTSTRTDYKGNTDQNTASAISKLDNVPLILVCKKNVSVLKKVIAGLKNLNTSEANKKIDAPLLVIDDEADNASVNTNKPDNDPTQINQRIRKLLALFRQSSYVGFTATPFANVFIQPTSPDDMENDDLFPRDFIYSLNAPSNYVGPSSVFSKNGKFHGCLVDLNDALSNSDVFSFKHGKDWDGDKLFPSFYESIIAFCLANSIRDLRGDRNSHRSMLINMSRFIDVQNRIAEIADYYLSEIKKTVRLFGKQNDDSALTNPVMSKIHWVWMEQYEKCGFGWEEVKNALYDAIKHIKVVVVNSKSAASLNYEENKAEGLRVIAVGGLALSRGLTLEGLMTSYFYRNTCTYDVLMQMGRWFGYRPNYADIVRIWIPAVSSKWYGEIADAVELMRRDIAVMISQKKTPREFGIRVRNDSDELGITASNKMRNTVNRVERTSFYGGVFENTFVTKNPQENEHNWDLVDELSTELPPADASVKKPYYRNVPLKAVLRLLEGLCIPKISVQFDREQIVAFLKKTKDLALSKWDVLIMSKENDDEEISGFSKPVILKNGLCVNPILRSCTVGPEAIAVSGGKSHIGSRDTKYGLSKEQIDVVHRKRDEEGKEGTSQKMYMIPGRNPLLIVYAVTPNFQDMSFGMAGAKENWELCRENFPGRGSLVAFSVAFPRTENMTNDEAHLYTVNRGADYYERAGIESGTEEDQ